MQRLARGLAALTLTIAALAGAVALAGPAAAGTARTCTTVDAAGQTDPSVCLRLDYTRPAAGKIRLIYVQVDCSSVRFSHPAIDPSEFWVHGSNGLTVWNNSAGNSFECGEAWWPSAITCSCANLQGHLFGKARIAGTTDSMFTVNTYT